MTARQWFRMLREFVFDDLWLPWLTLVVPPAIAFGIASLPFDVSWRTKMAWAGGLLEIMGVGAVAAGLVRLRRDTDQPPLNDHVKAWIAKGRRLLGLSQSVTAKLGGGTARLTLGAAGAFGDSIDRSSVYTWLAGLDARIDGLTGEIRTIREDTKRGLDDVSSQLTAERAIREASIAMLRDRMDKLFVGGVRLETFGLACVLWGLGVAAWASGAAG